MQQSLIEQESSFKIGHGNEIYLCDTRDSGQKYWHFVLIAKNKIGYKMLKELSSIAWINSYYDRRMERVVTLKSDLERVINKYGKGNLIASTACLGSELDYLILKMVESEKIGDTKNKQTYSIRINNLILWCKQLFDDDFYLEVQPAQSEEQLIVNNRMTNIGKVTNTKLIVTTDAHYLSEEDRETHTAFLNSKGGERETSSFYRYAYLQSTEEVIENLKGTNLDYYELEANTLEIYNKLENYSLANKQQVPQAKNLKDYPKKESFLGYQNLDKMYNSDNIQERYWVNQCIDKLKDLNLYNKTYLNRLEEEADIKATVGKRLNTCMFAYPIFLQQMIDTFWECGSPVGAGRGSAGSGLNHFLLGITQVDPVLNSLPFWRYMNHDTKELGDIDLDLAPSKREEIFKKIRKERGQLGCVQIATFSTASSKSSVQIACRGYRSEDYPDGIDSDTSQYIASLIPSERGFLWPIHDMVYGNEEKGRKPNKHFIEEVNKYSGLLSIIENIEGLVTARSIHASGVNFYDNDPFESACFMKATNGSIITQYSLHDAESNTRLLNA